MTARVPRVLLLLPLLMPALRAQTGAQTGAQTAPGTYANPILYADYSDPDVIRDGNDFYLVSSTFTFSPGLSILHSRDLVHWELAGHALSRLTLGDAAAQAAYDLAPDAPAPMRYSGGVWAPAVRFHAGLFYIYFPTPDEGIFVVTAPHMTGPWSAPETVLAGPGLEDPCPFWDDDGTAWLIHSRKGAGPLILHRMSPDGKHLLDAGKVVVDDPVHLHTLEGPKLYKRDGWYYIFAPFGGVGTGAQAVLRSRSIEGPYEARTVLAQGQTAVNGPHQGAWVTTPDGKSNWFVHFQLVGGHGRIVWLEPMQWGADGWPTMGQPVPGAPAGAPGEPVLTGSVPLPAVPLGIATSDTFSSPTLAQQWEWNHNPDNTRWSLTERPGCLRLRPTAAADLFHARNTLTESMQDRSLQFTVRLDPAHLATGDLAGLSAFDRNLSGIGVTRDAQGLHLFFTQSPVPPTHSTQPYPVPQTTPGPAVRARPLLLRLSVHGDTALYSYSLDGGKRFQALGQPVHLVFSWWKGARPALFSFNPAATPSSGWADFTGVQYRPLPDGAPAP